VFEQLSDAISVISRVIDKPLRRFAATFALTAKLFNFGGRNCHIAKNNNQTFFNIFFIGLFLKKSIYR